MRNNPRPYSHSPHNSVTSLAVMSKVGLDLSGFFYATSNGRKHNLNMMCKFSKYIKSVPIPDARSTTIAHAILTHFILVYGTPFQLISDNTIAFSSSFSQEFCNLVNANKRYTTPYRSAGNGAVERTFRTFQNMLSKHITPQNQTLMNFYAILL